MICLAWNRKFPGPDYAEQVEYMVLRWIEECVSSGTTLAADDSDSSTYCKADGLESCMGSRDGSFIGAIRDDLSGFEII